MNFGELVFVAAIWGMPLLLLAIAWRRYRPIHAATNTNRSLVRASLVLLSLSSGMWLLLYALALLDEYSKMAKSIVNLGPTPVTLAVINILVCFASFVLTLFLPKTIQENTPFRRAVVLANGYMVLVWMFALTAH